MTAIVRLVTSVEVHNPASSTLSVSARLEAELVDGSRILLLDDRGWGSTGRWFQFSAEDVRGTARMVIGPDGPSAGESQEAKDTVHWDYLSQIARSRGAIVEAEELKQLPNDVVLSQQILSRIGARSD